MGGGEKGGKSHRKKTASKATVSRTSIENLLCTTEAQSSASNSKNPSALSPSGPLIAPSSASAYKVPSHPPPLVHFTPQSPSPISEPFTLCFISGNISVCYGCRQKYQKPCQPPDDLCVRHKEWRDYFPSDTATAQTNFAMYIIIAMHPVFKLGVHFSPQIS